MGIRLAGALDARAATHDGWARWTCALVNNMPDAAFCATERQFVGLLAAGSGSETVALTRYDHGRSPPGRSGSGSVSMPSTTRSTRSSRPPRTCWW